MTHFAGCELVSHKENIFTNVRTKMFSNETEIHFDNELKPPSMEIVSITAPPELDRLKEALDLELNKTQNWLNSNGTTRLNWLAVGGILLMVLSGAACLIRHQTKVRNFNENNPPDATWSAKWFAETAERAAHVSVNV